jgi:hypothetical protein
MTDKLKPCPFCGGEAACIEETDWEIGCYNGQCATEPSVWTLSKERAIAAWNTRAAIPLNDPLVLALVEALRRMVYETTSLSPLEDDGSHWCKISKDALAQARAALIALEENK